MLNMLIQHMRLNRRNKFHPGQGIVEYIAGMILVSLLLTSVFMIYMPNTLTSVYNQVFDSVENTFGF